MIKKASNIADEYQLLQRITQAFDKQPFDTPDVADGRSQVDCWYVEAFTDILDTKERATKDDGAALGEIARTYQADVQDKILNKLDPAGTQTIAAFLLIFARENPVLEVSAQTSYLQKSLEKLWHGFRYAQAIQTYGATVEALTEYELADTMDLTKKYGLVWMSDAFDAMSEALAFEDDKYIVENLFLLWNPS